MAVDDRANTIPTGGCAVSSTESSTPPPHRLWPDATLGPGQAWQPSTKVVRAQDLQRREETSAPGSDITIILAAPDDADNVLLVQRLTDIVNTVYAETEADIWGPGFKRTSKAKVAELIRKSEIAVAYRYDHTQQQQQQQRQRQSQSQSLTSGGPPSSPNDRINNPHDREYGPGTHSQDRGRDQDQHKHQDGQVQAQTQVQASQPAQSDLTSTPSLNPKEPIAIIGCIQITQHNPELFEFGMLAIDPALRGTGIGRQLVHFAESHARRRRRQQQQQEGQGHTCLSVTPQQEGRDGDDDDDDDDGNSLRNISARMQLHLLVPASDPNHAFKTRLRRWYERMGYAEDCDKGTGGGEDFAAAFPALAPLLAGPVVYHCLEKELF